MTCPRFVVIIIIVFAFEFGNADCHLDGAIGKAPGYILNTLCLRDSHIYLRSTLTIYQKFATTSRRTTGRCAAPEFHYNCVKNRLSLYPFYSPWQGTFTEDAFNTISVCCGKEADRQRAHKSTTAIKF